MKIVIRHSDARLKVFDFDTPAEANRDLAKYHEADPTLQFFRVIKSGRDYILRRLKMQPGSEVRETRLVSATFEDDV